jgi:hypothetical protein
MWSRILPKGALVRVVQSIRTSTSTWKTTIAGVVESWAYEETGAWYAHGKLGKLWLPRIRIRKPDGELTVVTVDRMTEIEPRVPAKWSLMPPSPAMPETPTHREEMWGSIVVPERNMMPLPGVVSSHPPGPLRMVGSEVGLEVRLPATVVVTVKLHERRENKNRILGVGRQSASFQAFRALQ